MIRARLNHTVAMCESIAERKKDFMKRTHGTYPEKEQNGDETEGPETLAQGQCRGGRGFAIVDAQTRAVFEGFFETHDGDQVMNVWKPRCLVLWSVDDGYRCHSITRKNKGASQGNGKGFLSRETN